MSNICNKLEKLIPPPLLTLPVPSDKGRKILSEWSNLEDNFNYETHAEVLDMEFNFLKGYIARKGTQLRLEKALLLTTQVLKLSHRWQKNDFLTQFKLFQSRIVNQDGNTEDRYPTSQWGIWILYLSLRDSAILTKIRLECENTTKYWLGLIDGFHHFGDSLVITGILARIWQLSSKMVEQFVSLAYPTFRSISGLLRLSGSVKWPEGDWEVPEDLALWLRITLKLEFQPAKPSHDPTSTSTPMNPNESTSPAGLLKLKSKGGEANAKLGASKDLFFLDTTGTHETEPEDQGNRFQYYTNNEVPEDTGVPIERSRVKKRKTTTDTDTPSPHENEQKSKAFRKHWRKFFVNINVKLKSPRGRKLIVKRIKRYSMGDFINKKIRLRLRGLMREVRDIQEDQLTLTNAENGFIKFQEYIIMETKRLKKGKI